MAFVPTPNGAAVATGMTPVAQGALYADEVFIDGVTFTSQFKLGQVGQVQVVKYSPDNTIEAKAPGADFTDTEPDHEVIDININNGFQKSVKVPLYYQATMPVAILADTAWNVSESVRVGRQKAALGVLIDGGMPSDTDGTKITEANAKSIILQDLSYLRTLNAHPDVVLCSVAAYTAILSAAGKDFDSDAKNMINREGRVGKWLGLWFIECTTLSSGKKLKYRDADGSVKTVDSAGVDYIMYDHMAFSILDQLVLLRVIDNPNAAGSKVQEEIDSGFKVTNGDCVMVHTSTAHTVTVTGATTDDYLTMNGDKFSGGSCPDGAKLKVVIGTSGTTCAVGSTSYEDGDTITVTADITVTFTA